MTGPPIATEHNPKENGSRDQNRTRSRIRSATRTRTRVRTDEQIADGLAVRKRHELVYQCKRQSTGNGRDSVQLLTVSIWNVTLKTTVTNALHLSTV